MAALALLAASVLALGEPAPQRNVGNAAPGRALERVHIGVRLVGGGDLTGETGEYGLGLGLEIPFASRWSVGANLGLQLGDESFRYVNGPVEVLRLQSNFRVPLSLELRWSFLRGGAWQAQAGLGGEVSYTNVEGVTLSADPQPSSTGYQDPTFDASYGVTVGPCVTLQLGYQLSDRLHVRLGARYVAAVMASGPDVGVSWRGLDGSVRPAGVTLRDPLHHQLYATLALDLLL